MNRQLAPARPIALHGGAPMVPAPAAPPIPRVGVSNAAVWWPPVTFLLTAPLYWLMFVNGRSSRTSLATAVTITLAALGVMLVGAVVWMVVLVARRNALRAQLRTGQLRVGTVAQVDVNRYPAGIYVNKSNVSGFSAHVDLFLPEHGVSQRVVIHLNRTRMPAQGEAVLVCASPRAAELVAFGGPHGWTARPPFALA